jgi:hypothetical protein
VKSLQCGGLAQSETVQLRPYRQLLPSLVDSGRKGEECRMTRCRLSVHEVKGSSKRTYHNKCFPFGIVRTALTGPLTLGNLKVLLGSRKLLCKLYSSTEPFLRPAYIKFPSGDQQAFIHQGGVFPCGVIRATGFDCRRSQMRKVPSIEASKNVVSEDMGCSACPNKLSAGFSISSACGRPLTVAVD